VAVKKGAVLTGLLLFGVLALFGVMKATGWETTILFPVTRAVREAAAPLEKGIAKMRGGVSDLLAYFGDNKALRRENEELKKQIAALEEKVNTIKEKEMENERLRALLNYQEETAAGYELALAKVIGRDPGNWYKTVIINKGKKQGVERNMAVVTHEGLVGVVINTTSNTAEVLLILDAESGVGARILESRVTPGVVVGTGRSDYLQMIHLPHDIPLEKGQTVITSGLGGLYPGGIRIGSIVEVSLDPSRVVKNALVQPFVDFSRLEEVFVIMKVIDSSQYLPAETGNVKAGAAGGS
jgi:rod shape-determining protein MreC